ncbi:hypothetical protein [Helicobacter heilmannii]|uniref:hypothetical protein n=1 Tax=Helicobacter heilmannii TaxID=35817 RepID=UPI0006B37EE0|nr:hypothetical protein [Helicobacter heilmannii]
MGVGMLKENVKEFMMEVVLWIVGVVVALGVIVWIMDSSGVSLPLKIAFATMEFFIGLVAVTITDFFLKNKNDILTIKNLRTTIALSLSIIMALICDSFLIKHIEHSGITVEHGESLYYGIKHLLNPSNLSVDALLFKGVLAFVFVFLVIDSSGYNLFSGINYRFFIRLICLLIVCLLSVLNGFILGSLLYLFL